LGKSIVHCADCGKAIREDDFAKGTASTIDSRTYCSTCRAVTPAPPRNLDLPRSSSSRIPLATNTPRKGVPAIATPNSRLPLIAGGTLVGIGIIVLLVFAVTSKRAPDRVADTASTLEEAPQKKKVPAATPERAVATAKVRVEAPLPAAAEMPAKRVAEPATPPDAATKTTPVESSLPPQPRLVAPQGGATFPASTDITIEAELRDPEGRVARIEFWQGPTKLGETAEVPYRFTWKGGRPPGIVELRAKSIDRSGKENESSGVRVTIEPDAEPAPAPAETSKLPEDAPTKQRPAPAEDKSPESGKELLPQVDPKKVDLAVKKGVQYLTAQAGKLATTAPKDPARECHQDEFVLWALMHAGVPESNPAFRHLFKTVTEAELRRTYEIALQAMILEELDRVRYQERIQQCAQFLVDNQCRNGQWGYGEGFVKGVPTVYGALPVPTTSRSSATASGDRQKPVVTRKLKVVARRSGPAEGDNSNAQYAALGIRACADAGIVFPDEMLQRARSWFRAAQHEAEGGAGSVATGTDLSGPPAGWCYESKWHGHGPYGSMTAGAVGALAIFDTLLGEDWRKDRAVASGLSWLAKHFSVTGNPGPPSEEWAKNDTHWCHLYYLYALERAGMLCRTEWIGRRAWYAEGATVLLAAQGKDGAWNESTIDTCFAILFLKRATRPLEDVASMDARK
jgi:hypothetical protein